MRTSVRACRSLDTVARTPPVPSTSGLSGVLVLLVLSPVTDSVATLTGPPVSPDPLSALGGVLWTIASVPDTVVLLSDSAVLLSDPVVTLELTVIPSVAVDSINSS